MVFGLESKKEMEILVLFLVNLSPESHHPRNCPEGRCCCTSGYTLKKDSAHSQECVFSCAKPNPTFSQLDRISSGSFFFNFKVLCSA